MAKKVTLFKSEFVTGCLDVDLEDIKTSVMDCYANARFMAEDSDDIRAEDVRIPYTEKYNVWLKHWKLCGKQNTMKI